jgi:XTP/dITP diphosphohydrolase
MKSFKKLLIASHNRGKIAEIKQSLSALSCELLLLSDLGITHDVQETGTTFAENAALKAREYAQLSGMPCISDDGGLEVAALGGQPGIYSSRYAGPNKTDQEKVAFLLDKLKDVPVGERQARFVSVLAVAWDADTLALYEGTLSGCISMQPRGKPVYQLPYRQIFIPDGFDKTLDELDEEGIAYRSHRDSAFEKLIAALKSQ